MTAPATEKAAPIPAEVLAKLVDLVEELCEAVDCECDDIGGKRGSLTILREIGPLVKPARAIMQDRADRASQEERIREDERDRLYANLAGDGFASAGARASFRANGAMLPSDRARLRGDAS